MKPIETTESFNQTINSNEPVVVKFEADWCPDCKRLNMFIDDIIKDYNFDWYEVNRDQLPELADKYEVMGIPSLLVFQNGEKIAHLHSANAKTPESVRNFLDSVEK
ncbi:thioredoxin-like negative regulator of GroEL [Scopulibacillus daqui]|uniref:Thioredoxin-like negative regulator of GroEL n=1 Tax=Scopulibacillus daqui TaxID=1469162 RepID=A0ABS2Q1X3_9BACL|nr:thioredoxin family protein [Scopulibacillus daqui]MBM7646193.1 thioredoxin-like negative regulator of GroEL [Scopulibacillus daqui]